jgi:hypothetical protein
MPDPLLLIAYKNSVLFKRLLKVQILKSSLYTMRVSNMPMSWVGNDVISLVERRFINLCTS